MVSEQIRRPVSRTPVLDLRSQCPVCGNPYQPGEGVLTLASLSFVTGAVSPSAAGWDPSDQVLLGHRRCVLPRLLTLLAGFQPERRFALASEPCAAGEPVFLEHHHDEP
jgi:hypothetical protein